MALQFSVISDFGAEVVQRSSVISGLRTSVVQSRSEFNPSVFVGQKPANPYASMGKPI